MSTAAWGVFCACSWTWCIGMYLPHLLLDRFGWPGFAAFAAVNVAGCSLFGYVLGTASRSRALVERHAGAMRWFSAVTVGYHLFFVGFLVALLAPGDPAPWLPAAAAAALLAAGLVLSLVRDDTWPVLAVLTWGFSVAVFARLGLEPLATLPASGDAPAVDLAFLAPVMAAGFLLCPYFDLTFHRALARAGSRHAFAVFGATFAVMLLLSCAYWPLHPGAVPRIVAAHLLVQSLFTVAVHLRELRLDARARGAPAWPWLAGGLLAVPVVYAAGTIAQGQAWYLRFMVFYGLVFPAYAIVFMIPRGAAVTRRNVALLLVAVALLAPCYELAFIDGRAAWLIAPLVAAAMWLLTRARRGG